MFKTILASIVTSTLMFAFLFTATDNPQSATLVTDLDSPVSTLAVDVIPNVVADTIPAVVSIVISADVPVIERYYRDFWSPWGGRGQVPQQRQIGTQRQEIGGGTGFFVSADGFIVTNRHVVDLEGGTYSVVLDDGQSFDATVVAKDETLDIAILKIESDQTFPFLTFADMDTVRLGEPVIAIGNALAEFPNSVSVGVVSGLSRNIVAGDQTRSSELLEGVIQSDAAINRGNSGGPLLDSSGRVIGVNVAVAGNGENIGFALPADEVSAVFDSVVKYGEIVRPFLGVQYQQITPMLADELDLPVEYGVLLVAGETGESAVVSGSAAEAAGLQTGDIILELNGERLDGAQSFGSLLRSFSVGETINLTVRRADQAQSESLIITLGRF